MSLMTGYYAVPLQTRQERSKVHFVDDDGPICRAPMRKRMAFQWCAHGWRFSLVECDRCRNIANKTQRSPYD